MEILSKRIIFLFIYVALAFVPFVLLYGIVHFAFAQGATSDDVRTRRAQLEVDLAELEAKIEEERLILQEKQRECGQRKQVQQNVQARGKRPQAGNLHRIRKQDIRKDRNGRIAHSLV